MPMKSIKMYHWIEISLEDSYIEDYFCKEFKHLLKIGFVRDSRRNPINLNLVEDFGRLNTNPGLIILNINIKLNKHVFRRKFLHRY